MATTTRTLDFMTLSPFGAPDASLAIAGSRAGAIGVLNLEFATDRTATLTALESLRRFGRGRTGVLVDGGSLDLVRDLLLRPETQLGAVVVSGADTLDLPGFVEQVHARGGRVFLVVTRLAEARAGERAQVDALIAKGHEAGGWVGEETSFVLLQRLISKVSLPVWVQGGVGLHTAAACYAGGAAGVVLDNQLLLTKESPLTDEVRARLAMMDGSETICPGGAFGARFRAYMRPNLRPAERLLHIERELTAGDLSTDDRYSAWRRAVRETVDWRELDETVLAIGQDAAFAHDLAKRFGTVGGVITAMRTSIAEHCEAAEERRPLAPNAPLAESNGTRFPIVQGPMTRVSDQPAFAAAVAEAGALPFLALALLRASEVRTLLEETRALLGDRPWGVGLLGFVPPELRAEQLEVIHAYRPPFALIAGGRADQANSLEAEGIPTYLHVPSPGLLQIYLKDGAKRFVFEGRECGGHVGPRTSFVLWDTMIRVLLDDLPARANPTDYHVLFAGGIHDALSASMVAAMMAPLSARGIRSGVLLGTAYLFTREAVSGGAITPAFQEAAVASDDTVLLESGPGHATRCLRSPFAEQFEEAKRELLRSELPREEIRHRLEELNIGRLRIASKGVDRNPEYGKDPDAPKLVPVGAEEQWATGMYMIGQVAVLRDRICSMDELHRDVSIRSMERLAALSRPSIHDEPPPLPPADVAIVGMGCIVPGASDTETFWDNILNKVDAVTEIPADRWDWRQYFDADRSARDRIYSRWGGFINEVPFDPLDFGMPPNTLTSIEPFQLLALLVVRAALKDAGMLNRPFPRERTSVVLGAGGGGADLSGNYMVRSSLRGMFGESADDLTDRFNGVLPEWTEDSFPGILMNVASGRVANRFDFGGVNYTVDAACASSLAAVYLAVRDLQAKTTDVAVVGGVDAIQTPFSFLCFSKTQALSPTGRCRPFDATSDGIAISEGFAAVVLKRLEDAERDGDRIYAVIRGVGGSSDGRDRSLTAPRPDGQIRAMRRAYAHAGISPATVELIEAHGTGTVAGDQAEVQSLTTFFSASGAPIQRCAVGSVKSMIGHTKATAGVAGLIKVALALHHQVLPPTLGVTQPNPKANFPASPFYVNTEARPWVSGAGGHPRRAGVSAFGFGGTNFHVVLEEYTDRYLPDEDAGLDRWPAEVFVWRAETRAELTHSVSTTLAQLEAGARPRLADLAYSLALRARSVDRSAPTLAVVASKLDELVEKLRASRELLDGAAERQHTPQGIHFSARPFGGEGHTAFLFPGQGSQYVNMGRDLAVVFPDVRRCFDAADRVLADHYEQPLSRFVFPPPVFSQDEEKRRQAELTETNVAQPALGATDLAYLRLLRGLGIDGDMFAGHSYGEFVALHAAGCFDEATLFRLSEARGRFMREGATGESGTMAAVSAAPATLQPLLSDPDLTLANLNAPLQTVISGSRASVECALEWCAQQGIRAQMLPVACAFHSPYVSGAQARLAELLRRTMIASPLRPVFSNTTAAPYPDDPGAMVDILADHLVRPVEFVRQIEAMHDAGARVFVEVGPRTVLTGLVDRILGDRPHLSVALDQPKRPGLTQLLHGLATLASEGLMFDPAYLFGGREVRRLDLAKLDRETGELQLSPTTWMISGGRVRPAHRPASPLRHPLHVAVVDEDESATNGAAAPSGQISYTSQRTPQDDSLDHQPDRSVRAPEARRDPQASKAEPEAKPMQPVAGAVASTTTHEGFGEMMTNNGDGGDGPSRQGSPLTAAPAEIVDGIVPASGSVAGASDVVMAQFQQVMQHFLETQRSVMLAYLGHRTTGTVPVAPMPKLRPMRTESTGRHLPAGPAPAQAEPAPTAASAPMHAPQLVPAARMGQPAETHAPVANGHEHAAEPIKNGEVHATSERVTATPTVEPPRAPEPVPAASALPTRQELVDQLLATVSERTGYPPEMLELDVDLEADLGVDSIKRVEIAGTLVQSLTLPPDASPDLEQLSSARTLNQVVDTLEALIRPAEPVGVARTTAKESLRPFETEPTDTAIGRLVLNVADAPVIAESVELNHEGIVVIVDDDRRVGEVLSARLAERGYRVARVAAPGTAPESGVLIADLTRSDEVANFVGRLREQHGRVSAVVHLAPLSSGLDRIGGDLSHWRDRLDAELKSLFLLTQALREDLEAAAAGGSAVLAATAMGGAFACESAPDDIFAGQGAVVGYVKTLSQEFAGVRGKAVDVSPADPARIADWLLAELFAGDDLVEVGYRDGHRTTLTLATVPVTRDAPAAPLTADSVLLVTGGARGITAETALRLARSYHPILILVGRTLPAADEPEQTARFTEPQELRKAIIDWHRAEGLPVTPARVEETMRRILREREVRENLDLLRREASSVEYLACDVRDPDAFGALIDDVYARYGRIHGVIHGAGIIEDKLIRDKQLASFERVVSTKVDSAVVLAQKLRPESLGFLVFYSSVSGRFGNRGQGDYAAASEVLNKLARELDRRWPAHVVSINWGPWLKTGMVSPEVRRQFAERGVELIPPPVGCLRLEEEIHFGRKGDVEVLIGGIGKPLPSPGKREDSTRTSVATAHPLPLLSGNAEVVPSPDTALTVVRRFTVEHDRYLNDHRLDGHPVVPFAVMLELMAETAAASRPELEVTSVQQIRVLQGVTLDGPEQVVRVEARQGTPSGVSGAVDVDVAVVAAGSQAGRVHYRSRVALAPRGERALLAPPSGTRESGLAPYVTGMAETYARWLFHGPTFQGLVAIEAMGPAGARAIIRPSWPVENLASRPASDWLVDPIVVDSAFQLQLLWARLNWDVTLLPAEVGGYHRVDLLPGQGAPGAPRRDDAERLLRCEMYIQPGSAMPLCRADHYFYATDGRLVGALTGVVGVGSKALNRLAGVK